MKRFVLGILCAGGMIVGGCQTTIVSTADANGADGKACPAGRDDARAPIVCVDDSDLRDLRVHPEPVELVRGSSVQWFTRTGRGNLSIVFDDAAAFDVRCTPGAGTCTATTTAGARATSYKYSVRIAADGETYELDPTVTVVEAP